LKRSLKKKGKKFNEMCIEYSKIIGKDYQKLDSDLYDLKQDISRM
jgi:hypothetical protein